MNDITFTILKIVVSFAATIVTSVLVPYIVRKIKESKYASLLDIVEVAVKAAEQVYGSGCGKLKKDEVINFVSDWMNRHGIKITSEQLSQLIEAAVFRMNNEDLKKEV